MTDYKQTDPRWKNTIYQDKLTYGAFGCFITSLGNLVNLTPPETAAKLIAGGGLVGGLIQSTKAAQILGLEYNGISQNKPNYDCIAETTYWDKPGTNQIEQHFFIVKVDGKQQDPLGLKTNYPIKSYRLFKGAEMDKFTTGQARRLYEVLGRREPENESVITDKGWSLFEQLAQTELEPIINSMQGRINDLIVGQNALQASVTADKTIIEANVKQIGDLQTLIQNNQTYMDKQDAKVLDLQLTLTDKENTIQSLERETVDNLTWGQLINLIWLKIKGRKVV